MTIHLPKNAVSFKIHPTSFVETLCKSRIGTNVGHRNQRPHKFVHNCNVHLVFASYAASYVYIDFSWYMSNAMTLYKSKEGKPFWLAHRWTLLNKCPKWQDLVVLSLNNPQHYIQEAKGHQWLKLIVDPHGWRWRVSYNGNLGKRVAIRGLAQLTRKLKTKLNWIEVLVFRFDRLRFILILHPR